MDTFGDAVAQLQGAEAGGFAFSPGQAASLLNEGVKRLASRSEWIKAEIELGPTVAGQEGYLLPANVVRLEEVAVNGIPYDDAELIHLWNLKLGRARLSESTNGVYVQRFNQDGKIQSLSLWPIPGEDGLSIASLASITPADLILTDPLPFPVEYRRAVLDYAKGIAYEDVDENPQSGTYFIERADRRGDELRMLTQSKTGKGPYRIPVASSRRRTW